MPDNPHDVYRLLVGTVEEGKVDDIVGVIAFGLFWDELEEWRLHQAKFGDDGLTQDDINGHIQRDLPDRYFSELRDKALQLFGESAVDFLSKEIERERQKAVEGSILSAVETRLADANAGVVSKLEQVQTDVARGSHWGRQLGMALLMAVAAPVALGLILAALNAYELLPAVVRIGGAVTSQGLNLAAPP